MDGLNPEILFVEGLMFEISPDDGDRLIMFGLAPDKGIVWLAVVLAEGSRLESACKPFAFAVGIRLIFCSLYECRRF